MATADRSRLVVFDLDGTLVDSEAHIVDAMQSAFEQHDLPGPGRQAVRQVVGLSLTAAIERLAPRQSAPVRAQLGEAYRRNFLASRTPDNHEPLFPGVVETLDSLGRAGYLLGIATGKSMQGLRAVLASHRLADRFVTLQTPDHGPGKPHPDMLNRAMDEAGVSPGDTVVVGDTSYDMTMSASAGVAAIGVSWGYHAVEDLLEAGAARIIDRFDQLEVAVVQLIGAG